MADTDAIRTFIRREFLYDKDASIGEHDILFPDLIDSLGVMELVDFVEETYSVDIEEDELLAENFSSLSAISALIDRKAG